MCHKVQNIFILKVTILCYFLNIQINLMIEVIDQDLKALITQLRLVITKQINRAVNTIIRELMSKGVINHPSQFKGQQLLRQMLIHAEQRTNKLIAFLKKQYYSPKAQEFIAVLTNKSEENSQLTNEITHNIKQITKSLNRKALQRQELRYREQLGVDEVKVAESPLKRRDNYDVLLRMERNTALMKDVTHQLQQKQLAIMLGIRGRFSASKEKEKKRNEDRLNPQNRF